MSSMHVYQPETAVAEVECAAPDRGGDGMPSEPASSGVRDTIASEPASSDAVSSDVVTSPHASVAPSSHASVAPSPDSARDIPSSPRVTPGRAAPVFDASASRSWAPAPASAADWVSRELHREVLERFVPRAARVLEVSPGRGTFTEVLHRLACKVSLCSASADELARVQARASAHGYTDSIEASHALAITALDGIPDGAFDVVVAYHAALSHALERRDRALSECMRVLRPRGLLVLSVGSLWGTLHRALPDILAHDLVHCRAIIRSGNAPLELLGRGEPTPDLPPPSSPAPAHGQSHLFRAAELEAFLRRAGLELLHLSASSALSTGVALPSGGDSSTWSALLEYERAACVERGYLDSGASLIAVCRR